MLFSSPIFLFLFLPAVLALHFIIRRDWRNGFLLFVSLLFYAWGEKGFVLIILGSIGCNYLFGIVLGRYASDDGHQNKRKIAFSLAILFNVGLLCYFKYLNFIVNTVIFGEIRILPIHLPIGISFFTFQALSYIIDVYRRQMPVQKNPINLGLYISFFPELLAGPILRYSAMAGQIAGRSIDLAGFSTGVQRFIVGLGKKVLIANTLAAVADQIFALKPDQLTVGLAWLGILCYTLQIYFDFSGYSDMAIGLGRMFGFEFMENFNYPYISRSIREFWRRWHISLSTWFRDYLYIPLGGSRGTPLRTYINLLLVFLLCGLWHGANWTFVIWGLWHGCFLALERMRFGRILSSLGLLRHAYAIMVIMIGWVLFRSADLTYAVKYLMAMGGFAKGDGVEFFTAMFLNYEVLAVLWLGIIFSAPVYLRIEEWGRRMVRGSVAPALRFFGQAVSLVHVFSLIGILALCMMKLASGTYNPFVYFQF